MAQGEENIKMCTEYYTLLRLFVTTVTLSPLYEPSTVCNSLQFYEISCKG